MEHSFYFVVEAGRIWSRDEAIKSKSFDAGYTFSAEDYQNYVSVMRAPTVIRNEVELMDAMLKRGGWPKGAVKSFPSEKLLTAFVFISPDDAKGLFSPEELNDLSLINASDPRLSEMAEICGMEALLP